MSGKGTSPKCSGEPYPGCWFVREHLPDCHKIFVKRYHEPSVTPMGEFELLDHGPLDKAVHFLFSPIRLGKSPESERKNVMKRIIAIVLALSMAMALAACGGSGDAGIKGVEDGVLTVGMECAYAPYNWQQPDDSNGAVPISNVEGSYANGYDVMMAKKICEANGWKLEVVRLDWDGLIPAVMSKQVDAVIAGQSMTADRMEQVDFAGPYLYATICCLVKADGALSNATKIADFAGYRCTSQMSTIWYDSCLPQIEGADIQPAKDSAPTMLMALSTGDVDFVCTDMPTAQAALIAFPEFKLIEFEGENGFEVSDEDINIGISLKKGNTELKNKIDAVLSTMDADAFNALMAQAIAVQPLSE